MIERPSLVTQKQKNTGSMYDAVLGKEKSTQCLYNTVVVNEEIRNGEEKTKKYPVNLHGSMPVAPKLCFPAWKNIELELAFYIPPSFDYSQS